VKYLTLNESRKREIQEHICEILPDILVSIFLEAFIIETVDLIDFSVFVVATENADSIFEANFQSENE